MDNFFKMLAFAGLCVNLCGCEPTPIDTDVHARVRSPDGKLDAIYAEDTSGGPMTGVFEAVYITPTGQFPRHIDRVFSSSCEHDVKLSWIGPKLLRIDYAAAPEVSQGRERDVVKPRWFTPWLWGGSPSHDVLIRFYRRPAGPNGDC